MTRKGDINRSLYKGARAALNGRGELFRELAMPGDKEARRAEYLLRRARADLTDDLRCPVCRRMCLRRNQWHVERRTGRAVCLSCRREEVALRRHGRVREPTCLSRDSGTGAWSLDGEALRRERRSLGVGTPTFARHARVSRQWVIRLERRHGVVTDSTARLILAAFRSLSSRVVDTGP